MARLLVVHSEAGARKDLEAILAGAGHEVFLAANGASALGWVKAGSIDLVFAEASLQSPGASELRQSLRRAAGAVPIPFVFICGEDDRPVLGALAQSEDFVLLRQPFQPVRTQRILNALLGEVRRDEGKFGNDSFDRLLAHIDANREGGMVTAARGTVVKRIHFRGGQVAFAASNDARELIGQAFVHAGLITETELRTGLKLQADSHQPLAKVLQTLARISPEQATEVVRLKFEETVLDLYLWNEGSWSFTESSPTDPPPENALALAIPAIRVEGARRAPRWKVISKLLPDDGICFTVDTRRMPQTPSSLTDRKLAQLAADGASLGQMKLELRGIDFALYSRVAEFVEAGGLIVHLPDSMLPALVEEATTPSAIRALFLAAEKALVADEVAEARTLYRAVLQADASNVQARRGLMEIEQSVSKRIRDAGITSARSIVRRLTDEEISERKMNPRAAFILSRIEPKGIRIGDLAVVTPLPESEVLEIVEELVAEGIISLA